VVIIRWVAVTVLGSAWASGTRLESHDLDNTTTSPTIDHVWSYEAALALCDEPFQVFSSCFGWGEEFLLEVAVT
jgi:hypothetical protein